MKSALVRLIVLALVAVFTLSCGGGGGGGGGSTSTDGGGGGGGATVIGYVYALNNKGPLTAGVVSVYQLNSNGLLTMGSTANTGKNPCTITIDPSGKYAYVTNTEDKNISQYTIGANGALTANGTKSIGVGLGPNSLAIDPSGKYAYVSNYGNVATTPGTISQFTINADGTLSDLGTATLALGTNPYFVAVHPSGDYAYVVDYGSDKVLLYNIGGGGTLSAAGSEIATGSGPSMMAIDPAGNFAYVTNWDATTISQYSVNAGNGTLTSNGPVAAGNSPFSITIDPTGKYAYASNYDTGVVATTISQYNIVGGALTDMTTVATGKGPTYLVVNPSGKYAFVGNVGDSEISMYTITTGKLAPNSPATISPVITPVWMAIKGP